MSEIVHVYRGEYVSIDLVDDTTELTVENNVYSLTESVELEQDLLKAMYELRKHAKSMNTVLEAYTYSEKMQNDLEPIDE